jgi:hypothetical protein
LLYKRGNSFFHGLHCLNENIKTLFEKALIKRNIINLRNYQLISGNGGNIDKIRFNFDEEKLNPDTNLNTITNALTNNLTLTIRSDNGSQESSQERL